MNYNPNRNKGTGRFEHGVRQPSAVTLTVVDSVDSEDAGSRAAALMSPECSYEQLENAARNDGNTTVRLTAVAYVPEAGLEDENPFVRALAQDLSGTNHDPETARAMDLLCA